LMLERGYLAWRSSSGETLTYRRKRDRERSNDHSLAKALRKYLPRTDSSNPPLLRGSFPCRRKVREIKEREASMTTFDIPSCNHTYIVCGPTTLCSKCGAKHIHKPVKAEPKPKVKRPVPK